MILLTTYYLFLGKKKKSDEHSVEDINNAVLTASNGYMTRRRFQEQLESKLCYEINLSNLY